MFNCFVPYNANNSSSWGPHVRVWESDSLIQVWILTGDSENYSEGLLFLLEIGITDLWQRKVRISYRSSVSEKRLAISKRCLCRGRLWRWNFYNVGCHNHKGRIFVQYHKHKFDYRMSGAVVERRIHIGVGQSRKKGRAWMESCWMRARCGLSHNGWGSCQKPTYKEKGPGTSSRTRRLLVTCDCYL